MADDPQKIIAEALGRATGDTALYEALAAALLTDEGTER